MDPSRPTSYPLTTQIRWACAELARRMRAGEAVRCEQWFEALPGLAQDEELAIELIYTEYCTREELGETPQPDEYLARFPGWHDALQRQFEVHRLLADEGEHLSTPSASSAEGGAQLAIEDRVGPFVVLRELGRGGMGIVYAARHATLGRIVALKMVSAQGEARETLLTRLNAEAQAVARLRHPNIVQLYEIGASEDGRAFLAFEFMEAGSLAARIAGKPQDPRYAAYVLKQLAEGAATAHRAGVVHCDLTPGNILFASDGTPKIADFGLARWLQRESAGATELALAGTPSYMAPEQIDHPRDVGPEADVYSLGAVLYEMLTGRPPLLAATPMETLAQVRTVEPVSPRQLRPSLPRDLVTICLKCLEKDPRRRYSSADELAADLECFLNGEPISARSVGVAERTWKWSRRHPALAAACVVAAFALLTLVVGGGWYNVRLQAALETLDQQRVALHEELDRSARNLFTMQLMQIEQLIDRNPAQAAVMLDSETICPFELRDFAWGLMRRRATQDRLTLGTAGPAILSAGTTPDGLSIVAVSADRRINWFDAASGEKRRSATFEVDAIGAATLSPDRTQLAVGDGQGVVRIWQLDQLNEPRQLEPALEADITALTWSSDRRLLAAGSADGMIRAWNVLSSDGDSLQLNSWSDVASDVGGVLSLAFNAEATVLASGGSDGAVRLWNAVDGTPQGALSGHRGGAKTLAFAATGEYLAVGSLWDPRILWWHVPSRTNQPIDTRGQPALNLTVSNDNRQIIAALADDSVRVFRLPGGDESLAYRGHAGAIHQVTLDAQNTTIITASGDGTVKLWNLHQAPMPTIVPADPLKTLVVAWSPDGTRLVTAGHEGVIRIWDPREQREIARWGGHGGAVLALRFVPNSNQLCSASDDGSLRLWSLDSHQELWRVEHPAEVLDLRYNGTRQQLVTLASDGKCRNWRVDDGALADEMTLLNDTLTHGTLSDDGRNAAWVTVGNSLGWWSGVLRHAIPLETGVTVSALAFSCQSEQLAWATLDRELVVFDLAQRTRRFTLVGHTQLISSIAFSAKGQTLFSGAGSSDIFAAGEVKLWDLATGQIHATLPGYNGPLSVDPHDRTLAVTDRTGRNAVLWHTIAYDRLSGD